MGPRTRRSVRGATAIATLMVLAIPGIAWAHAHLTKSTPGANATLPQSPHRIQLWFSEAPEVALTKIALVTADSVRVALGPVVRADSNRLSVSATVLHTLAPGHYTVLWSTVAADGHPSHGHFAFRISAPSSPAVTGAPAPASGTSASPSPARERGTGTTPSAVGAPGPVSGAAPAGAAFGPNTPAYVIIRWISFTALLVLLGVVAFRTLVLRALRGAASATVIETSHLAGRRAALLGIAAAILLELAAVGRLYCQLLVMQHAGNAGDPTLTSTLIWHTQWGWSWLVQATVALVAIVALALAFRGDVRRVTTGWVVATIAVLVLAFTPALGGHAIASSRLTTLAVFADGAHVIGAGGWLGSLLTVVVIGIPTALRVDPMERGAAVAALVNAFSPTALTFAGIVAVTGLFATWLHVQHVAALWHSTYGRTLLIKLAVLAIVAGAGAYNWRRVKPTLGLSHGARRVRRSANVELIAGAIVIIVTAVLVALPTPVDVTAIRP